MARIRSIKPSFFLDDELAALPPLARLLFAGLWTQADAEGRLEDRPRRLKVELLPYDDVDIDSLLSQLDAGGFIQRYEAAEGRRAIQVTNFLKHQRLSGKEASEKSTLRAPPREASGKRRGSVGEAANVLEGKGREGKGRERNPAGAALPAPSAGVASAPSPEAARPTIDQRHASTVGLLAATWKAVVGTVYHVAGGRDGSAVKRLLAFPEATDDEIVVRFRAYLADPFNVKQASMAHFVSKWSSCVPQHRARGDPRVGTMRAEDCHLPDLKDPNVAEPLDFGDMPWRRETP